MNTPDRTRRVLFITYEFPPSLEIGAHASSQITRYLPLYGWEPVVLTVQERYFPKRDVHFQRTFPDRVVSTRVIPHPIDIYARLKSKLSFNSNSFDTDVQGDLKWSGKGIATLRRWTLSLLKTPDVYTGWIVPAIIAGLREVRRHPVTHLCSSAPYWSNHLIGLALSRLTGLSWTAHFRDPWRGIPQWKPESAMSRRIDAALERMVVNRATSVVCVTDLHTSLLRCTYPELLPYKFVTIPNGFDEMEWSEFGCEGPKRRLAEGGSFVILYAGSVYQWWNPVPLFRALRALVDSGDVDPERVMIDLVGWCEEAEARRLREAAKNWRIADCITFTGPLGRAETRQRMARAEVLLLLGQLTEYQIPGKTYEYLRAGRPILALTSEGALADLLRKTGGAWVVKPADHAGIVAALQEAYGRWKKGETDPGADRTIVNTFDRRLLAGRLAKLFDDTCRATN